MVIKTLAEQSEPPFLKSTVLLWKNRLLAISKSKTHITEISENK